MSDSALNRVNIGAYSQPFSGVGVEYYRLGCKPDHTGLLIHEVGFLPRSKNWNFPSVFSPFWRLYYNSKPGHCISIDGAVYELGPESIMLIPNHQMFHCLGANPVPAFWIAFSVNRAISPSQPVPILLQPKRVMVSLMSDIKKLISQNTNNEPTDAIYRNALALLNVVIANANIHWKKEQPFALKELLGYIERNYAERLTNSHLAAIACMSVEGLSRMFRNYIGTSPAAYVTQIRIKQACYSLLNSSKTIDWIAEATGFPNRNYFSRIFKKITNESPARFRKLHGLTSHSLVGMKDNDNSVKIF